MKRLLSVVLCTVMMIAMITPMFAAEEADPKETSKYTVDSIVASYTPSEKGAADAFAASLPAELRNCITDAASLKGFGDRVFVVVDSDVLLYSRQFDQLYKDCDEAFGQAYGLKRDNGFAYYSCGYTDISGRYVTSTVYIDGEKYTETALSSDYSVYGDINGQWCSLALTDDAIEYLASLDEAERCGFLYELFYSLTCEGSVIGLVGAAGGVYGDTQYNDITDNAGHATGYIPDDQIRDTSWCISAARMTSLRVALTEYDPSRSYDQNKIELLFGKDIIRKITDANYLKSMSVFVAVDCDVLLYSRTFEAVYGRDPIDMFGIKKSNNVANYVYGTFDKSMIDNGTASVYGSAEGQLCALQFTDDAIDYLAKCDFCTRYQFLLRFFDILLSSEGVNGLVIPDLYFETNGEFKSVSIKNGDVNGDGLVNLKDTFALKSYVSGGNNNVVGRNSDLNDDGVINTKDVFKLKVTILNSK